MLEAIPEVDDEGEHYLMVYAVSRRGSTRYADEGELRPALAPEDEFDSFSGDVLRRQILGANGLRPHDLFPSCRSADFGPRRSNLPGGESFVALLRFYCVANCCVNTLVGGKGASYSSIRHAHLKHQTTDEQESMFPP